MNKKYVIAGVVVVILIVAGAIVLTKKDSDSSTEKISSNTSEKASSDVKETKDDLGACTIVEAATIKSALGDAAASLGSAQDTGVTSLGDGDKGQTCVYPFAEGASVSNSFYVDIASYSSQATFDDVTQYSSDGITVGGVGDVAYFTVSEPITSKSKEFSLNVHKDKKVILFVISQPKDSVSFTNDTAQSALTQIAKTAKL